MNSALLERDLSALLRELISYGQEQPWLEFKHNNDSPELIGSYISALANSAALEGRANGYVVWGVDDATHAFLGTDFDPESSKKGNEPLVLWLRRLVVPEVVFGFSVGTVEGKNVVVLEVPAAAHRPVAFSGAEYIRVGSSTKKLKDHPELERQLWQRFDRARFEQGIAAEKLSADAVLGLLNTRAYFDLLKRPIPGSATAILHALEQDRFIIKDGLDEWAITNLGAALIANSLADFPSLRRKTVRIVQYTGGDRLSASREEELRGGYASEFEAILKTVALLMPSKESIDFALRNTRVLVPILAAREVVANALIHQDFSITGTGPIVEIFTNRIEVTNPGAPLIDVDRFLDNPPRSRNEAIAAFMRRAKICEELGSGIDKVIASIEAEQLPAPEFQVYPSHTKVTLHGKRDLKDMRKDERVRATYLHAALRYINGGDQYMTNASLRERFGIEKENSAMVSRIIKDALEAQKICLFDKEVGLKARRYVPWWAGS
jgi:ATP-dependent DNA helicase RecG